MELLPGTQIAGCLVLSKEELPEIDGTAYLLEHRQSKARICYLANGDNNKAFSITFKTIPSDDSGVFHILEHSVLCGSDKFPVKEPFVNLLKTSMQTFLNAMTFPDKTMYPVASTNEQDLMNLADVYLDAVFHPAFYRKPTVFQQEGWHLEPTDDGKDILFNGVVFNEMKGALSDPSSMLYLRLQQALFPQTAYRFESGGTPEGITQLSYEQFLSEHQRYYRPDNSYIILYGNLNVERMLSFLDKEYLGPLASEAEKSAAKPLPLAWQEPVCTLGLKHRMVTSPENSCAALGYVVGSAKDKRRTIATSLMLDALLGSNEAPLKRALLDANIASDVQGYLADSLSQPFAAIELRDLAPGAADAFRSLFEENVRKILDEGLDHDLVEASLSRTEFLLRERDAGIADGVALAMSVMSGWLYDEDAALDYVRYEEDLIFFREALNSNYFEQILEELFLGNPHQAEVEIIPVASEENDWESTRLSQLKKQLDEDGLARIAAEAAALKQAQEVPDSPEALATLPQLSISDIEPLAEEPALVVSENTPLPFLHHMVSSHGIDYLLQFYSLDDFAFEDLPDLALFSSFLGKLETADYSASQLDTLVNGKLGSLHFSLTLCEADGWQSSANAPSLKLTLAASALEEKVEFLTSLPFEIMTSTRFTDTARMRNILQQRKLGMEQSFAISGHSHAMARVSSYHSKSALINQNASGVEAYQYLCELLEHFDERAEAFAQKMERFAKQIFRQSTPLVSFTGPKDDLALILAANEKLCAGTDKAPVAEAMPDNAQTSAKTAGKSSLLWESTPEPTVRNEAFIVPCDVCFASAGVDRRILEESQQRYTGAWTVAARALSYDFLWNEVRVKGGAYGAGFQARPEGPLRYYSYRDPNLDKTLQNFANAAAWLRELSISDDELEGYVVSSVAAFDAPVKTRALIQRQTNNYLKGKTFEDRKRLRQQIIGTNPQELRDLGAMLVEALDAHAGYCVFGNREIIERSELPLAIVPLIEEVGN